MSDDLSCLTLLRSTLQLERIEGLKKLKNIFVQNLKEADSIITHFLHNYAQETTEKSQNDFEIELLIATCILLHSNDKHYLSIPPQVLIDLRTRALIELSQASELDLRQTSGSYIGSLCKRMRSKCYLEIKDQIMSTMQEVIQQCLTTLPLSTQSFDFSNTALSTNIKYSFKDLPNTPPSSPVKSDIFNATSAWKLLDTWIYTLNKISLSLGVEFCGCIDQDLVDNLEGAMKNTERFVRESCCGLLQSLVVECKIYQTLTTYSLNNSDASQILSSLLKIICLGMSDPWPDVRFPACVAARQILLASRSSNNLVNQQLLVQFLPYLCFNRYSTAVGLQKYSQDTWVRLTRGGGKELIEENFQQVFNLYHEMILTSPSSECKEIALHCLSECVKKLDKPLMSVRISDIFNLIISPEGASEEVFEGAEGVKDAGCVLVRNLLQCFPTESTPYAPSLTKVMLNLTEDSCSTIRQSSASILALLYDVTKDNKYLEEIFLKIKTTLNTLATTQKEDNNDDNNNNDNEEMMMVDDDDIDDEKLETRLNAFRIDSVHSKTININHPKPPKNKLEAWEKAEGCALLIRSLSAIKTPEVEVKMASLIPLLIESLGVKGYDRRELYVESVLRHIPEILQNVGNPVIMEYLEALFDVIIECYPRDQDVGVSRVNEQAVGCLRELGKMFGAGIVAGKLKQHNNLFYESTFKGL